MGQINLNFSEYFSKFAGFEDLQLLFKDFFENRATFPDLPCYKQLANTVYSQNKLATKWQIGFIDQEEIKVSYEKQIAQYKQVYTRANHWHDFFNNLSWMMFAKTKLTLNQLYCNEWSQNPKLEKTKQRTKLQNFIAGFDECGLILVSTKFKYFKLLKQKNWHQLFLDPLLTKECKLIILGHGLLEKALCPYIGLTGKALVCKVDQKFFELNLWDQYNYIDDWAANFLTKLKPNYNPKKLLPLPILGWPKWYCGAQDDKFYQNTNYFRK